MTMFLKMDTGNRKGWNLTYFRVINKILTRFRNTLLIILKQFQEIYGTNEQYKL